MSASLVGSEMCIRDRVSPSPSSHAAPAFIHCCCEPRSSLSRACRQSHDVKDVTKEDDFTQASSVGAVIQLVR
eukprot:1662638-Alexandrium_andersonii.AAC.1